MGLIDYDERMAIIIQKVTGEQHKQFFFPTLAGVGFSRNPFLWTPRLRSGRRGSCAWWLGWAHGRRSGA